jgi:N-acetylmuramoyl-L-alanine amidase
MKRVLLLALVGLATQAATPPARTLYTDALDHEQAVRAVLAVPEVLATILPDVRAVVAEYEAIVKHYPASGYSDNALWNAGRLSLDAFARFNQQQDKNAGIRLLNTLAAMYPTSKLAKQVPEQLARVAASGPERPAPHDDVVQAFRPAVPTKIATIREIRRSVLPETVRITIELDGEVTFHDERITDPERVFVDLSGTRAAPSLVDRTLRFDSDDDIVRQVRIGRHPNHMTRVVLDGGGVSSYSVYPLYSPFRLVIDCVRASATKTLTTRTLAPDWARAIPSRLPRATATIAAALASLDPPPLKIADPVPTAMTSAPATPITPPARNATGGFSIARQLGLGVSRIVIDPGHGGHDPGAKGKGVTEAELVLDVALRLEKLLAKAGMDVILTRRSDEFIPLQERPAIANREAADLFLSIHANASPNATARGIETYFLNFANNPNAAQVAARENAASALSMGTLPDVVKAIALNNKVDESRDFAAHVQHAMVERLRTNNKALKDLGVKQAPFIVLIGATMPSVLAEISFVTNTQEARLLKGNVYRQRIAEALFNAIKKYQTSLKNVTTVAHQ